MMDTNVLIKILIPHPFQPRETTQGPSFVNHIVKNNSFSLLEVVGVFFVLFFTVI